MCSTDIFLGVLALLFPPLPVWVKCGICSADSIINILLCMLGYIPGLIHSWYIIAKFPESDYEYQTLSQDSEQGGQRITYLVVTDGTRRERRQQRQNRQQQQQAQPSQPKPNDRMSYGTTNAPAGAGPSDRADAGEGRSDGPPPPSYAQVVAGDNKVQSQD